MQASLTCQLAAVREQQTILQAALNKQQHDGELLSNAQEARVLIFENTAAMLRTQLENTTQSLVDTKTKVTNLKADLKTTKQALSSAQQTSSQETDEQVVRLNDVIGDLKGTITKLSKHAEDILGRYKLGRLVRCHLPISLTHSDLVGSPTPRGNLWDTSWPKPRTSMKMRL
jgi:RNA processing factor Prp31